MLEKILQEIEEMSYPFEGMGCGIENAGITDVYEATAYGWNEALERIYEIIRSHMEDDGWIPVEERLPEYRKPCLVTVRYSGCCGMHGHWIKTGHLESDGKWWGDCIGGIVIAWKPLPEPYRPKEEN